MLYLALALILAGAAALILGAAVIFWPAGLIVGGVLALTGGRSIVKRGVAAKPEVKP